MQFIVPNDAQGVVIAALNQHLPALGVAGVYVDSFIPSDAQTRARFVTVQRTGGFEDTAVTDRATLDVAAYVRGQDDAAAFALIGAARAALFAVDGDEIAGVFVNDVGTASGPANFPDPRVPTHQRVRQTIEIVTRMRIVNT